MPCKPKNPSGGFKVVYEYSKMLISDGHEVTITYPFLHSFHGIQFKKGAFNSFKYYIRFLKDYYFRKTTCKSWFKLPEKVKEKLVFKLENKYIEDSDFVVATAWSTAEDVEKFDRNKGEKFYLIQSFEDWGGPKDRVLNTWKSPLKKIVISEYLKKIADDLGEEAELIENGLDFGNFYYDKNINKEKNSILMLYHSNEEVKRSREAIKNIIKLKDSGLDFKLKLFGVEERPDFLPEWIEYWQKPKVEELKNLYNSVEIFVSPSKIEGWPLPVAEALQCKTMVCVTDIPGHSHIKHLETGYKIGRLEELPETLRYLFGKSDQVNKLAENGYVYISRFTWEVAYSKLKKYLLGEKNDKKN